MGGVHASLDLLLPMIYQRGTSVGTERPGPLRLIPDADHSYAPYHKLLRTGGSSPYSLNSTFSGEGRISARTRMGQ